MEKRVNQGYEIVQSIEVGTSEFVLGVSQYHPEQFVTWKCSGKTDYYWGHYTDSLLKATKDLCERALEEIAYLCDSGRKRRRNPHCHTPGVEKNCPAEKKAGFLGCP